MLLFVYYCHFLLNCIFLTAFVFCAPVNNIIYTPHPPVIQRNHEILQVWRVYSYNMHFLYRAGGYELSRICTFLIVRKRISCVVPPHPVSEGIVGKQTGSTPMFPSSAPPPVRLVTCGSSLSLFCVSSFSESLHLCPSQSLVKAPGNLFVKWKTYMYHWRETPDRHGWSSILRHSSPSKHLHNY